MTDGKTPPQYDVGIVEAVILEVAAELHPTHLTIPALTLKIAANPDDEREVQAIAEAICGLRSCGLFRYGRRDKVVEPTPAGRRAVALLTR
jgi:hypothetical protein